MSGSGPAIASVGGECRFTLCRLRRAPSRRRDLPGVRRRVNAGGRSKRTWSVYTSRARGLRCEARCGGSRQRHGGGPRGRGRFGGGWPGRVRHLLGVACAALRPHDAHGRGVEAAPRLRRAASSTQRAAAPGSNARGGARGSPFGGCRQPVLRPTAGPWRVRSAVGLSGPRSRFTGR
jgi:hypothetical protein